MMTIWKFELAQTDKQTVSMPRKALIIKLEQQRGVLCIWALVESKAEMEDRQFRVHGTGHPIDHTSKTYIGTVLMPSELVWHVFEENKRQPLKELQA